MRTHRGRSNLEQVFKLHKYAFAATRLTELPAAAFCLSKSPHPWLMVQSSATHYQIAAVLNPPDTDRQLLPDVQGQPCLRQAHRCAMGHGDCQPICLVTCKDDWGCTACVTLPGWPFERVQQKRTLLRPEAISVKFALALQP